MAAVARCPLRRQLLLNLAATIPLDEKKKRGSNKKLLLYPPRLSSLKNWRKRKGKRRGVDVRTILGGKEAATFAARTQKSLPYGGKVKAEEAPFT